MEHIRVGRTVVQVRERMAIWSLAALLFLLVGLWNVSAAPILWDEGWTLSVARNWVELGHYGQLQAGAPTSPGLSAAMPVVAPIALSFHFLGVGLWQGRLVGIVFTLGALASIAYLAKHLYSSAVAWGTVAVLLLMSGHWQIHPLLMGRVMWAEMSMMFYVMVGYVCWFCSLRKSLWFIPLTILIWGIALRSKGQMLPFWMLAQLAPLVLTLVGRRWRRSAVLGVQFVGALVIYWCFPATFQALLGGQFMQETALRGLYDISALVTEPYVRLAVATLALALGLPTLLGIGYAARRLARDREAIARAADTEIVRLSLLVLAGSWFAWYALLSAGIPRYLLPATFIGAMFAAALLHDLTDGFRLGLTFQRLVSAAKQRRFNRQLVGAGLALFLALITMPLALDELHTAYFVPPDRTLWQAAEILNTQTPSNALIETHDAELFFLLQRRYHYPPEQTHIELIRRAFLLQNVPIDYDPLPANPDYLVVGPFNRGWRTYDTILATGAFRLLHSYGSYDIYERVR
jgi:hypothetical protein